MSSKNTVELILSGNSSQLMTSLQRGEKGLKRFGQTAKHEFDRIRNAARSAQGQLASLGVSIGAVMVVKQSAQMDKSLTQIGQTAGATKTEVTGLRKELFRMSSETGQAVEDLQQGFNNAVQSGLNFKEALPVIDATNKAMAVTGANANQLTSGLTVAATAFQFDLSKPNLALGLLDKMTVAGRLGNAELQNLSDIFARVGVNASDAGMGFDQTLAFIEGLSLIERQPERLATLADSTLRLFTNLNYMKQAQANTKVRFFDDLGERRNPLEILTDIKKKYDSLKTTAQRVDFMGKALKGADQDTVKGLRTLLKGDMLGKVSGEFAKKIAEAAGTINRDLPDALDNAIDQTGRLKAKLKEAADEFATPIKGAVTYGIQKLLNKKRNSEDWAVDYDTGTPGGMSGLGLSGKQLIGGGLAALLGGYGAYKWGGPLVKNVLGRLGGTGLGIAEGKILQETMGVTPVFVVNMPSGFGGTGTSGTSTSIPKTGNRPPITLPPELFPGGRSGTGALALGAAGSFAALTVGTAVFSAVDIANGGTGKNWIGDALDSVLQVAYGDNKTVGDRVYDAVQDFKSAFTSKYWEQVFNISVNVDQNGRTIVSSDKMNANVKANIDTMNRGHYGVPQK